MMATQSVCMQDTGDSSAGALVLPKKAHEEKRFIQLLGKIKTILRAQQVIAIVPDHTEVSVFVEGETTTQKVTCDIQLFQSLNYLYTHQHLAFDEVQPTYLQYRVYIEQYFGQMNRLVAFAVCDATLNCMAHICVFDQNNQPFDTALFALILELCADYAAHTALELKHTEMMLDYEQIVALNFSQTKFLQIIAHDLRAPFHGILGFSEVLAEELESLDMSNIQSISSYLNDTAKATFHLLENLLDWAMAEGGRFAHHPVRFDLKQSSKVVSSVLSSLAYSKNIELIDAIPEETYVYADLNMVTSILQNLVSNALKFTPKDGSGKVSISVQQLEQFVALSVTDTGLGMTELQKSNIFEKNVKMTIKGTNGEKGTGLGMVLCKRFADLNQGTITVQSQEGKGTTFTVQLPIEPSPDIVSKNTAGLFVPA